MLDRTSETLPAHGCIPDFWQLANLTGPCPPEIPVLPAKRGMRSVQHEHASIWATPSAHEISIIDVLKDQRVSVGRKHLTETRYLDSGDFLGVWNDSPSNKRGEVIAESNGTAAPNARPWSNYYTDRASKLDSRVREFISYAEDWDGDGAEAIPMQAIYSTLNFLDEFRNRFIGWEPTSVAPSPDGEVVVYWHGLSGYAEINFDGDGGLSMCWSSNDDEIQLVKDEAQDASNPDASQVWETLSEFLGQNHAQQEGTVQEVF